MQTHNVKRIISVILTMAMITTVIGCAGTGTDNVTPTPGSGTETTPTTQSTAQPTEEITPEPTLIALPTAVPMEYNDVEYESAKSDGSLLTTSVRASVHDPSVVYDEQTGRYYIFGSHKAWAVSDDLVTWKMFKTNISDDYATVFASNAAWSSRGSDNYNPSGNMWAPDVKYNEAMGKWCMYMSVNGDNYYSSIALAVSDSIKGPYEYAGTVVCSGFTTAEEASHTDYAKVMGTNEVASCYLAGTKWNSKYGVNAIDPCIFYDEDGELWMTYGSWFGGIYMLKLDNETGLRDYTYTYDTVRDESDSYLGIKLSGGYGRTGEGSYIVWDEEAGYYYLYISYCGLDATDNFSGYHIRLFRSKTVTGPYTDAMGNSGICTSSSDSQVTKGIKLFGNYYFSSLSEAVGSSNASSGYMSGGHNSAFIDEDGARYLVYHTRFNLGSEWHQIRVHQQFLNEEGWPVTAVYEYAGSLINDNGYERSEIIGTYEYVNHGFSATTTYTEMLDTLTIELNKDGTMTGDVTGRWEEVTGADGKGYYATFVVGEVIYRGVFFKQYDETKSHNEVMTFTAIGTNDTSIWGSKIE